MAKVVKLIICMCFLSTVESVIEGKRRKHENDIPQDDVSIQTGMWSAQKPRRLFARSRFELQQRMHVMRSRPKPQARTAAAESKSSAPQAHVVVEPPASHVLARRCPGLKEACSPHTPCCDPCATCHCRLFNTICHCWRMSHLCPKNT